MQVEAIVGADVRAFERRRHCRDVALPKLDGLQIGQAPPYFTQPRRDFEAAAIGGDAVLLTANRLQHMAVAHPHIRSEEQTSELQSLTRISYAVFCLNKKIYNYKQLI